MPSTVVHLALAALVGTALLAGEFDARSLAVVLAVTAAADLDTFVGIVLPGAHRAALHTLLIPLAAGALVAYDLRREGSYLRRRFGRRGVRVAWVSVVAYALAAIGPDLFFNGVNLFYPVHDRFYSLSGRVVLSNERGLVQTLWQPATSTLGTTANTHYSTGVDVARGKDPADAERVFPIARGGLQALLILSAVVVTSARLWIARAARSRNP